MNEENEKFYKLQSELTEILYLIRNRISDSVEYCTDIGRDENDFCSHAHEYNDLRLYEIRSIYDFTRDVVLIEHTECLSTYIEKLKDCYYKGALSEHTQSLLPKNTIELIIKEMEKIAYA